MGQNILTTIKSVDKGVNALQLPDRLKQQIIEQLNAFPQVQLAYIFGSRARGDARERSDIDLAIDSPGMPDTDFALLYFKLKEELDTLLSLDIVNLAEASEDLKNVILREGRIIYERRIHL